MKVNTVLQTVLLLVAGGLLGVGVWRLEAEPAASQEAMDLFVLVDRNGDRRIDDEEYDRVSDDELPLATLDADKSGALEPWEVEAFVHSISPLRSSVAWVQRAR